MQWYAGSEDSNQSDHRFRLGEGGGAGHRYLLYVHILEIVVIYGNTIDCAEGKDQTVACYAVNAGPGQTALFRAVLAGPSLLAYITSRHSRLYRLTEGSG